MVIDVTENWRKRYSFLTKQEQDILYMLSKSGIEYTDIKHMSKDRFALFINEYIKELKKINKSSNYNNEVEVSDHDVDTVFYMRKNKININKVMNKLNFVKNLNISCYPNMKQTYSRINSRFIKNKIINTLVMVVAFAFFLSGSLSLNIWNKDNKKTKKLEASIIKNIKVGEIKTNKDSFLSEEDYDLYKDIRSLNVDFNKLNEMNADTKGWVYLTGTTVNYPFVQSNDNEYYLNHDFNKKVNQKGWVFLDFRNDINGFDKNTILYAHGLINEKMFGGMRNVFKKEWLNNQNNHIIKLSTNNHKQLWRVFSIYKIKPEEYYITTYFNNNNEYGKFVKTIKERSEYDFNVGVSTDDRILTLSSCYSKGTRMVVHAKLISNE